MDKKEDDTIGSFYMGRMRPPPQPEKRRLGLLTIAALLALTGVIWYAYPSGSEKYTDLDVPVVKADTAPIKEQPLDPGGMEIRHQDSTVFDPMENQPAGIVEKLRPLPEEPLDKAQAIQSAEGKAPDLAPELDLALQMKDAGSGTEKIVAKTAFVAKPVAVSPKKELVKPVTAAVGGNRYIQLGSYRDPGEVKSEWEGLKKKYPRLLDGLTSKIVRVDLPGKGVYHRLHAGKVTEARAREICAALKTANRGGCFLVK